MELVIRLDFHLFYMHKPNYFYRINHYIGTKLLPSFLCFSRFLLLFFVFLSFACKVFNGPHYHSKRNYLHHHEEQMLIPGWISGQQDRFSPASHNSISTLHSYITASAMRCAIDPTHGTFSRPTLFSLGLTSKPKFVGLRIQQFRLLLFLKQRQVKLTSCDF